MGRPTRPTVADIVRRPSPLANWAVDMLRPCDYTIGRDTLAVVTLTRDAERRNRWGILLCFGEQMTLNHSNSRTGRHLPASY